MTDVIICFLLLLNEDVLAMLIHITPFNWIQLISNLPYAPWSCLIKDYISYIKYNLVILINQVHTYPLEKNTILEHI